jgi:hypothetical protein
MKEFYKTKGYTLIDYTAKIKVLNDLRFIANKIEKKHKGKFVYDKTVILIRFEEVCSKIVGFRHALTMMETLWDAVHLYHIGNKLLFDKAFAPAEIVLEAFVNRKKHTTCEVCCEVKETEKMMPCPKCIYPCCRDCFMVRAHMTHKNGKVDGRCFGCREQLVKEVIEVIE